MEYNKNGTIETHEKSHTEKMIEKENISKNCANCLSE